MSGRKPSAFVVMCVGNSPRCEGNNAIQQSSELSIWMSQLFVAKLGIPLSFPDFQFKIITGKKGQCG